MASGIRRQKSEVGNLKKVYIIRHAVFMTLIRALFDALTPTCAGVIAGGEAQTAPQPAPPWGRAKFALRIW
ncbi:MAG: hypothetical protein ACK5QX_05575 [bacterium]